MKKLLMLLLLLCSIGSIYAQIPWSSKDVMMQGFYWDSYTDMGFGDTKWSTLDAQADEISDYFTLVWLAPSSQSSGGLGYIPIQWCNQNCDNGSYEELTSLISNLHAGGCKVMADIVVNHKSGSSGWCDFPCEYFGDYGEYQLETYHICCDDEVWSSSDSGDCQYASQGGYDDGENYEAARDLYHSDEDVRNTVIAYLKWMKNFMGYDGWRFDCVKGFHPSHVNNYATQADAYISVGEYYDGGYDNCMWWLEEAGYTSMLFDFPFKFAINDAFKNFDFSGLCWQENGYNKPAGLIHHSDSRQLAVTFLDNHDTYGRGNDLELCDSSDEARIMQASALQLCAPGIPCVFYPHWQKYKEGLKPMIQARRDAEIHSNSEISVTDCQSDLYAAIVYGDNGSLAVKIGTGWYEAPDGYTLVTSGTDYAIWSNYTVEPSSTPTTATLDLSMDPASGVYPSGQQVTLNCTDALMYYTLDGSTPSGESTLYTGPITLPDGNVTLKAIGYKDNEYSNVVTENYNITDGTVEGITVKFLKPDDWSTVYLWAWDDNDTNLYGTNWPGAAMNDDGDGWWSYTFSTDVVSVNLLFNNGDSSSTIQTGDVTGVTKSTNFEYNGAGEPAIESTIQDSSLVNFTPVAGQYGVGQEISLSYSDESETIYYSLDGKSYTKYTGAFTLDALGEYTVYACAGEYSVDNTTLATATYTIVEPFTIYVKTNTDWGAADLYIYYYNVQGGSVSGTTSAEWNPAPAMDDAGNGWYSYTFAADVTSVAAIIKNAEGDTSGNLDQTVDITDITGTAYYEVLDSYDDDSGWARYIGFLTQEDYLADQIISEDMTIDAETTLDGVTFAEGTTLTVTGDNTVVLTLEKDATYDLPTVVIEGDAEINAEGATNLTITQLEIIKTFTYTGDNASAEWFNLGLPFEVEAGNGNVLKLEGDTYVAAEQGVDYATYDYNGATRAANGTGDNWIMYTDNSGNIGELIQFATTGTHTYKFVATSNDAAAALTDGRDGDRFFDTSKEATDDNGWNLVPAGKTYTTDYSIDGVTLVQEFVSGAFITGTLSGLTPGTVVAAQLTKEVAAANLNSDDAQATVETYAFELTDANGKLLDRIYLFDGSDNTQYRIGKMSALSSTAAQMTITIDGSSYCSYSTLASDINKTYTVALSNVTEGSQLTMTTAGSQAVTIDGVAATLNTATEVADGTIAITIGSQTSSVADLTPSDISVYTSNGAIIIAGAEAGASYAVTSISGVTIASGVTDGGNTSINLTSGVYILNVSGEHFKVIVK